MNKEFESSFVDQALKRNEEEAWLKWRIYDHKIDVTKVVIGIAHALEVAGVSLAAYYVSTPLICSIPGLVAINACILEGLEKKSNKYWRENWMEPFRTYRGDPGCTVIDLQAEDTTYPKLKECN